MSEELNRERVVCEAMRDLLASSLEKSLEESYQDYLVHGVLDIKLKEK